VGVSDWRAILKQYIVGNVLYSFRYNPDSHQQNLQSISMFSINTFTKVTTPNCTNDYYMKINNKWSDKPTFCKKK